MHRHFTGARLVTVALPALLASLTLGCLHGGAEREETVRGRPLLRSQTASPEIRTITTKSVQTQSHFEAGLRRYYEGQSDAAVSFFEDGGELDPGCAMCFWGVALALAPTNGEPPDRDKAERAAAAIRRAKGLETIITAPERGYIDAMMLRVTAEGGNDAVSRQRAYARAMQALASQYPGDLDAATLAAEASLETPGSVGSASKGVSAGPAEVTDSLQALRDVLAVDPNHPGATRLYSQILSRNLLVRWHAAMMAGQEAQAMAAAREITKSLSDDGLRGNPELQGAAPVLMFTLARFGHWKEILEQPAPANDLHYVVGMWYYSRGLAFTRLAQFLDVPPEQAELEEVTGRVPPGQTVLGTVNAKKQLQIAALVLEAEIEHLRAHRQNALAQIQEAVALEDSMGTADPPAFYVPTRQVYGALLLWNDRPADAEKVFREDLDRNPENGWSLLGLSQSLKAQKRVKEAAEVNERAQRAHAAADVKPPTSVF